MACESSPARDQTHSIAVTQAAAVTALDPYWLYDRETPLYTHIFLPFFFFLGLHLRHIEIPRLGVKLELQLLASTTATAMPDPSSVCTLHHSSQQRRILNPLSEARDQIRALMVARQVRFGCATTGTPI